jgi:hypothetical protein
MKKLVLKKETIQGLSLESLTFIQGGFLPATQQGCVNPLGAAGNIGQGQGAQEFPTRTVPTSC